MQLITVIRNVRKETNGWLLASLLGAAVILLPLGYILLSLFHKPNENWTHIKSYLLKDYVLNSVQLMVFTGFCTVMIGVTLAWLVSAYDFPLKRFFRWALVWPLAIPPYIAAYTYSHMMGYTGVIQKTLRNSFGVTPDPDYFDVMSMKGAVFIFTMFLFPYVYMITRAYLERQSASFIENARLLGRRPMSVFFRVVLPIARPAIAGGLSLVMFEVLSDYGVTSYFGIYTVSTAIFQTWFGMYDIDSAMRLAAWLMVGAVGLFVMERALRGRRSFHAMSGKFRPLTPHRLRGIFAFGAALFCLVVFSVSFLIPFVQLIQWAIWSYRDVLNDSFLKLTWNSIYVALVSAVIVMAASVITANVCRMKRSAFTLALSKIVTAGYSVPSAIIAIGVLALFIALDGWLAPIYGRMGLGEAPLVLSMSLLMMITAYAIRFMATGFNAVEAGYEKIGTQYAEASRLLGHGMTATFFKVDWKLVKGASATGFILTFVEMMKELPLALLLRPFNFETLATKTYQYANDEKIVEASIPSLFIICISILSIVMIMQTERKSAK